MGNKLRSFLSLVGITIGIFCIISVKAAVDSLENNIREGLSELGSETIYVVKFPWNDSDWENNYSKYLKRPDPGLSDYEVIKEKSKYAENVAFSITNDGKTIKHKSSSVSGVTLIGSTIEFQTCLLYTSDAADE